MFAHGAFRIGVGVAATALLLWAAPALAGPSLDIDGDGTVDAEHDGQLVLRWLLGFRGDDLVTGLLAEGATRNPAAVAGHLDGLGLALDVDGDGRAAALTDGVLILRHLLGRSGAALTEGALAAGAQRDDAAIATRIDALSTPPGEAPAMVELVQAHAVTASSIQLDWLPTFDNDTPGSDITYVLHASQTDNFIPDVTTARTSVVDDATGVIAALTPATRYYVKVEARDAFGHNSWSNQLSVLTAEIDPQDSGAPRQVLDPVTATIQSVEPDRIDYQLGAGASPPAVGDLVVSGEGEGFLRRAASVSQNGDEISVTTEPAALNELYDDLAVATDVKLIDLPETSGPQARAVGRGVIFQRSGDTKRAVWPDSGLTLIERRPPEPQPRDADQAAPTACDGATGERVSDWDRPLQVTYPEAACTEPDSTLTVPVDVAIESGLGDQYQITQLFLEKVTHPKVNKAKTNYGAVWSPSLGAGDTSGTGVLRWTPLERHVDDQGRPYTAHFVALAKERPEHCRGILDFCGKRKIKFQVDIYVAWGSLAEPGPQSFSGASAGIAIDGTAEVAFEPRIRTEADISGTRLRYGRVAIEGPISFTTRLNLRATAAAQHQSTAPLIDKQFIKVFYAGSVPIVITGRFQLAVEFRAEADAALDITQVLTSGYDIEAGLEYRDGGWHLIDEAEPWQRYKLTGEADTRAYAELRFVPDLELAFYDVATGRLIVEPYLYAAAALEGQFLYQVAADSSGVETGSDADYRFTRLEFGGGVDGKFRAGLEAFDQSIVGYPSRDQNDFLEFTLLSRTPIMGLPELTPRLTGATSNEHCGAVGLSADIANVPNPFQGLFGGPDSWQPFVADSAAWEVVLPDGTERIANGAGPYDAWFSAATAGQYQLRFSGHSEYGSFVRQYEEIVVDYDPSEQDCDVFGALQVAPPSGVWDSAPHSISISGTAAETIYYTMAGTHNGTTPPDPLPPTPTANDGQLAGPNASFEFLGADGLLTRSKHSFVGCTGMQCGPVSGPYEYRIDLRNCVEVNPPSGSWTSSPQTLTVLSPGADTIYYTLVQTNNGAEPLAPPVPKPSQHDGAMIGPEAPLQLDGIDGQITRSKLRFVGCIGGVCSPACESFEYRIDLRAGQVVAPTAPLNDTGIDWCGDGSGNFLDCPVAGYPGQDGESGRDVTHNDDSDGHAGFSFTKISNSGLPLPASAALGSGPNDWACTRDNVTGLIWEVKTDDGGLRDKDWNYTWYDGVSGYRDEGSCAGDIDCDTYSYIQAVNLLGLCGASDWRLATVDELLSVVHNGRHNPANDPGFFPNTPPYAFWSSSRVVSSWSYQWGVGFSHGIVDDLLMFTRNYIRLVRGGQ